MSMSMSNSKQTKQYTLAEVKQLGLIVIHQQVYDVSKFAKFHPGGRVILSKHFGTDATEAFDLFHNPQTLTKYHKRLCVGVLKGADLTPTEFIPYSDPAWLWKLESPYYTASHKSFQKHVRKFVDTEIVPTLGQWAGGSEPPRALYKKMGEAGLLAMMTGSLEARKYVPKGTYFPEDFDAFHEMILFDEMARIGHSSALAAITNGPAIALSAVLSFGSEEMKQKIAPPVLRGEKFIALAISEPGAGSDIQGLESTAEKKGDDFYVVNGNKKWITNGMYADYFITALITDPAQKNKAKAMSLFCIDIKDNTHGGTFTVRKVDIRDSDISGTAYLDFDGFYVPKSCLIGRENKGFKLVMFNFNHERMYIIAITTRLARVCLEESIRYAMKRKTFGKPLYKHQAIRMKIGHMIRQVESLQSWLESLVYQLVKMDHMQANLKLGDITGSLKAQASIVYENVARETTMIFGGNALMRGGPGWKIEMAVGQVKAYQIPAGAEDVLLDFSARAAFRQARL